MPIQGCFCVCLFFLTTDVIKWSSHSTGRILMFHNSSNIEFNHIAFFFVFHNMPLLWGVTNFKESFIIKKIYKAKDLENHLVLCNKFWITMVLSTIIANSRQYSLKWYLFLAQFSLSWNNFLLVYWNY